MTKRTGIILAWDKSDFTTDNQILLTQVSPYIDMIKVGLEAMTAYSSRGFTVASLVCDFARSRNIKIMWDMKLNDIANTVSKAMTNIVLGAPTVSMATLHATVSDDALKAAAEACGDKVLSLAVTVLTDLDEAQCISRFGNTPGNKVLQFAKNAKKWGINGLVCSPKELVFLKEGGVLEGMTSVIPGIRPVWASANDQKRVMTPTEAAKAGANFLVTGRPITNPPGHIGGPANAAKLIRQELDEADASA